MDIESGINHFLMTADGGIHGQPLTTLIGDRLWPERAQQTPTLPYITYTSSEIDPHHNLTAPADIAQYMFTFDIHAATTDSRTAVREALRNCLDGRHDIVLSIAEAGTVFCHSIRRQGQSQSDEPDDDGKEDGGCFVCTVDYLVTFAQPAPTLP